MSRRMNNLSGSSCFRRSAKYAIPHPLEYSWITVMAARSQMRSWLYRLITEHFAFAIATSARIHQT